MNNLTFKQISPISWKAHNFTITKNQYVFSVQWIQKTLKETFTDFDSAIIFCKSCYNRYIENLLKNSSVKTKHTINYNGFVFTISGQHEYKYLYKSKMFFSINLSVSRGLMGTTINNRQTLKMAMDYLIKEARLSDEREAYYATRKGLSTEQILRHSDFSHARYQVEFGGFYNLYLRDKFSPSGVGLAGACQPDVWEKMSIETGNSNNYLSPTEGRNVKYI